MSGKIFSVLIAIIALLFESDIAHPLCPEAVDSSLVAVCTSTANIAHTCQVNKEKSCPGFIVYRGEGGVELSGSTTSLVEICIYTRLCGSWTGAHAQLNDWYDYYGANSANELNQNAYARANRYGNQARYSNRYYANRPRLVKSGYYN